MSSNPTATATGTTLLAVSFGMPMAKSARRCGEFIGADSAISDGIANALPLKNSPGL